MKRFAAGLFVLFAFVPFYAQADSCVDVYKERIESKETFAMGVADLGEPVLAGVTLPGFIVGGAWGANTGAYLILAGSLPWTAVPGALAIPALLVAEHFIEEAVRDAPLNRMVKILAESRIQLGLDQEVELRTDFQEELEINNSHSGDVRRQRKAANLEISEHNRLISRFNKAVTDAKESREKAMGHLLSKLTARGINADPRQVYQLIADADAAKLLCNGEIRYLGQDLSERTDLDDRSLTRANSSRGERREQRKHNNEVKRHNHKVNTKVNYKNLAKRNDLIEYLAEKL